MQFTLACEKGHDLIGVSVLALPGTKGKCTASS